MLLDPVEVAPPGPLLDHVPGNDEISHDAMCAAPGYADLDGDVTDTYPGVMSDAEQGASVVPNDLRTITWTGSQPSERG